MKWSDAPSLCVLKVMETSIDYGVLFLYHYIFLALLLSRLLLVGTKHSVWSSLKACVDFIEIECHSPRSNKLYGLRAISLFCYYL